MVIPASVGVWRGRVDSGWRRGDGQLREGGLAGWWVDSGWRRMTGKGTGWQADGWGLAGYGWIARMGFGTILPLLARIDSGASRNDGVRYRMTG